MTKEKNIELVKNHVNFSADNEFFICGPGPMMDNAAAALKELKINDANIHIEYFSAPVSPVAAIAAADTKGSAGAVAVIILDGDKHTVELKPKETILEAALR